MEQLKLFGEYEKEQDRKRILKISGARRREYIQQQLKYWELRDFKPVVGGRATIGEVVSYCINLNENRYSFLLNGFITDMNYEEETAKVRIVSNPDTVPSEFEGMHFKVDLYELIPFVE